MITVKKTSPIYDFTVDAVFAHDWNSTNICHSPNLCPFVRMFLRELLKHITFLDL